METVGFLTQYRQKVERLCGQGILPRYFKAPVFVLWELTDKCNLSCIHCYYNSNRKTEDELTTAEALDLIEQLARLKVFEVYLTGGEALLRQDWPILVEKLRQHKMQVGIITNGTKIDEQTAKKLADFKVKWVQISIDGAGPEIHDRVRGLAGGWEKSINAIRYLKQNGIRTHVSFVPTSVNFRDVKKVIALCVEMGLEYFVTDMLVLTGRAVENFDDIKLDPRKYEEFYKLLEEGAKTYEDKLTIISPSQEKDALKTYVGTRSATPNIWGIITPQGNCRLDLLLPFTYGDLRKQSLEYVWNNFLRNGWERPEVAEFMESVNKMTDLVRHKTIPYVSNNIHCQ
jgi:MoaA/NifB/PqqE/SkfB family radical SAM enzyme